MKEKKVLTFDWDGTLLNSTESGYMKVEHSLAQMGASCPSRNFLRQHWGMPAEKIFKLILKESGLNGDSYTNFCQIYESIDEDYPLMKNIESTLLQLQEFDFKICLITSRTSESWLRSCDIMKFDASIFDFAQTTTHYYHSKPSGRVFGPLINWARTHGYGAEKIVYFGDTVTYDFKATKDSNPVIDFVGVVSGVSTKEEFLQAGLDDEQIINSYSELPLFLHNLIKAKVEA
jgi:phosphoglycolate phosphatase-like HAD superfamily hydrolase